MKRKINKSNEIIPKIFEISYGSHLGMNNLSQQKGWQRFWKKFICLSSN
jgi:hypothetical protein